MRGVSATLERNDHDRNAHTCTAAESDRPGTASARTSAVAAAEPDAVDVKRACPRTGRVCETGCMDCKPVGRYGTRNPQRDLVAHNRWARQLKREHPYCQRCGSTEKLDAHHGPAGGVVLCSACHCVADPYARPR